MNKNVDHYSESNCVKYLVLYVIDTLEIGGTERSLFEIASRLKSAGCKICHIYQGNALSEEYARGGIQVIPLRISGKYSPFLALFRLWNLVAQVKPDVIHCALFRASILSRLVAAVTGNALVDSLVSDAYGEPRLENLAGSGKLKLRVLKAIDRLTASLVDEFVANSAAIAQSNTRALGISEAIVTVIPRGRDPREFEVDDRSVRVIRSELELEDAPLVLNVARLRKGKGQRELVRAMREVIRQHERATLAIVGEGPSRIELEGVRASLDLGRRVRLLGQRDDVPALLAAADVFVFPSHFEGLPGALIEAMFARLPIVASDIPVHRECVDHGVSGLLVPVKDEGAIASAVCWLLDHEEEARVLGERAQRVASERFHIADVVRRHEELYEEVLARRRLQTN